MLERSKLRKQEGEVKDLRTPVVFNDEICTLLSWAKRSEYSSYTLCGGLVNANSYPVTRGRYQIGQLIYQFPIHCGLMELYHTPAGPASLASLRLL